MSLKVFHQFPIEIDTTLADNLPFGVVADPAPISLVHDSRFGPRAFLRIGSKRGIIFTEKEIRKLSTVAKVAADYLKKLQTKKGPNGHQ